ncbi:MAG: hypothetical protein ABI418_21930, partial [Jatrophihabitantaceae bacterium]
MKNLPKRLSVAAGLAVATMMTSSAVAFAATAAAPFTVTAGSSVTGVANVTGAASGTAAAPAFRLLNTITGATVNCVAAKLAGTATLGPSTGANLIQLNSSSYGGCTIVIGGSTFAATVNQLGTWHFNGTSTSGGLTTGVVSSVAIKVTSAACSFTAAG